MHKPPILQPFHSRPLNRNAPHKPPGMTACEAHCGSIWSSGRRAIKASSQKQKCFNHHMISDRDTSIVSQSFDDMPTSTRNRSPSPSTSTTVPSRPSWRRTVSYCLITCCLLHIGPYHTGPLIFPIPCTLVFQYSVLSIFLEIADHVGGDTLQSSNISAVTVPSRDDFQL